MPTGTTGGGIPAFYPIGALALIPGTGDRDMPQGDASPRGRRDSKQVQILPRGKGARSSATGGILGRSTSAGVGSSRPGDRRDRGMTTPAIGPNARRRIAQPREAPEGLPVSLAEDGAELRKAHGRWVRETLLCSVL